MKKYLAVLMVAIWILACGSALAADSMTCWFAPGAKDAQAQAIADALSAGSGIKVTPRIAKSYPEILEAFSTDQPQLVYVGSFVQAIIAGRKIGTPLVQSANGKEMYSGILIYPADQEPEAILKNSPRDIAYAIGASSGESTAKAATGGQAALGVNKHGDAVKLLLDGKAKAAVVKDWWWLANEKNYAGLKSYRIPGLSLQKNPDNVLTASKAVATADRDKISWAALSNSTAFGDKTVVVPFDATQLSFSLGLMKQGGINPATYSW